MKGGDPHGAINDFDAALASEKCSNNDAAVALNLRCGWS